MEISIELETCVVKDTMGIKRKARQQNPEALEVLCDKELRGLLVGDYVKISNGKESLWVKLTFIDALDPEDSACDAVCIGLVSTVPVSGALQLGEQIRFNAGQIVEVYV